jgi:tetratricopeptide (TPR) repeat protein
VGFNHNRYGAFCLQAANIEKAQEHLLKAKDIIAKRFVFTNVLMNLGNLKAQKRDYQKAIEFYEQVIKLSPHANPAEYQEKDQIVFSSKLNSFNAFVDAHTNLAVMYIQLNEFQKGFDLSKASL